MSPSSPVSVHIGEPRTFEDLENRRPGWDEVSRLLENDIKTLGGDLDPPTTVPALSATRSPLDTADSTSSRN